MSLGATLQRPVRIGVLAVQGDVREHLRALREVGAQAMPVRRPSELEAVDGLIIPGGESTTIDRLTRVFELREPLRERIHAGMPTYGSCAGMIMLADRILDGHVDQQTLGGLDITVRRNAFGRQVDSFEATLAITGVTDSPDVDDPADEGTGFQAVFIRAPWVEDVGADVEVLATVEFAGQSHVVAVRQGGILATSFHPEMTQDHRVHELFARMVHEASNVSMRETRSEQIR